MTKLFPYYNITNESFVTIFKSKYNAVIARGKGGAEFGEATLLLYFAVSLATQRMVLIIRANSPGAR